MVSADDKTVLEIHLSGGNKNDGPEGQVSIAAIGERFPSVPLLMDRAYEGDPTRRLATANHHPPVVPPQQNRRRTWNYDKD